MAGVLARMLIVATPLVLGLALGSPARAADACRPPGSALPDGERKYHPGHYVSIGRAELRKGVDTAFGNGVRGIQLRYRWADLEPKQDQYDFAAIARDLGNVARANLQLVVMIEDKSFQSDSPLPAYLQEQYSVQGKRGYMAKRWDPYVAERLSRLVQALGRQFDCNPNLEGIAFQETALGLDTAQLERYGYTPEKYRDALVKMLRNASDSLPSSRVFWYMNFLPGKQEYIADIARDVAGTGVVMGGPDILPDNQALERRVYPFYEEFRGRMKLFGSMQNDSYRHPHGGGKVKGKSHGAAVQNVAVGPEGYWSMEDLYAFARDRLHLNYIFWEYRTARQPPDSHDWSDAREVISRHPTLS
jgi:hypothetical protein